jgi:hypothetical protein
MRDSGDLMKNDCAQIVPKIYQKYQKISKDSEEYRKRGSLEKPVPTGEVHHFLRITFLACLLHTVEVTGSNPASPILSQKRLGSLR